MTNEDQLWLDANGFKFDMEWHKEHGDDVFLRKPPNTLLSWIDIRVREETGGWKFFIIFHYHEKTFRFYQRVPKLADLYFDAFIKRWNHHELPRIIMGEHWMYYVRMPQEKEES